MIYRVIGIFFICFNLFAQGWVSSGGENFKDAKNPWFLKNSKITYCVVKSNNYFSASSSSVDESIAKAFKYWNDQFSRKTVLKYKYLPLGSYSFQKEKCKSSTQVKFIFGHDKLSEDQLSKFGEKISEYVGVSVRTDYSKKFLTAKGFVFLNSDIKSKNKNIPVKAWSHSNLLLWALVHEIGHIFGIPHMGNSFMAETFMDLLLSKYYIEDFKKMKLESFLHTPKVTRSCILMPGVLKFFNLQIKTKCIEIRWNSDDNFDLYAIDSAGNSKKIAMVGGLKVNFYGNKSRPVSYIHVTDKQVVLTQEDLHFRSFVSGPVKEDFSMEGKILTYPDLISKTALVHLSPENISLSTVDSDGRLRTIFSYDSPITFILNNSFGVSP